MRLIDADALPVHKAYCVDEAGWGANFYVADKSDIDNAPTIDAVPVVRCKDCKNWKKGDFQAGQSIDHMEWGGGCSFAQFARYESDFCSRGERRSDD